MATEAPRDTESRGPRVPHTYLQELADRPALAGVRGAGAVLAECALGFA